MKPDFQKNLRRQLSSTTVWILVLFIVLDVALNTVQPLKYINDWHLLPLRHNPILAKLPRFFENKTKADVWVLGSSLPMMAIAKWDEKYSNSIDAEDMKMVWQYDRARYLEEALSKKFDRKVNIKNLTCVACMAAEARAILQRGLEVGKAPQYIVYGVGPRTFIDNTRVAKSPIERVIEQNKNVKDIWQKQLSGDEIRDIIFSNFWSFYKQKSEYKDYLVSFACKKLDRSPTAYAAKQRAASEKAGNHDDENTKMVFEKNTASKEQRMKSDLAVYDVRYNPPNFSQFEKQKTEFSKLLALCKNHGIKILVVGMPITDQNRALLDKKLLARYETEIESSTRKHGFRYLNLDRNPIFTVNDFDDSVHTNATGGRKVQDKILEAMSAREISL